MSETDNKRFSGYMNEELLEIVKDHAFHTGMTIADVLNDAVGDWWENQRAMEITGYDKKARRSVTKHAGSNWPRRPGKVRRGRPPKT